jgi:hypothetical protein
VAHTGLLELTHWLGVALATPAVAVVLLASWRAYATRRARHPNPRETT